MWLFSDIGDYFGSVFVEETSDGIIIGCINTQSLLSDMTVIWKNNRLPNNMFKLIRKHRLVIDKFFAPDLKYVISQILEFKARRSNKYRLNKVLQLIDTNTWMKSTVETHPDILDFAQLKNLKHTLFDHQVTTLKVYNDKVPKMQLKGFLLSTPPGCLAGDTIVHLKRGGEEFSMFLNMAAKCYNQDGDEYQNWDLKVPTYIRSYVNENMEYNEVHSITYSGPQEVFSVKLEDGNSICCTAQHPFKTRSGYTKAEHVVGSEVLCDGKLLFLNSLKKRSDPQYIRAVTYNPTGIEQTYDVVCKEPHHNFVANNIVVHNSGKTIMSIALSQCLHADLSIYIVPKNTVTTVWFDGIQEELGKDAKIWASSHNVPISENYDHYIFHYEALPLAVFLAKRLVSKRKKPFIAIDESHNLNEITSIRTLRLIELVKTLNCRHTVFASGTPIKALGTEVIPLLRCIDSFFTDEVEARFKIIYGMTAKRAVDILRHRLGLISHKIAEDSYMTAPKPIEITLPIKIPDSRPFLISTIKEEMRAFMDMKHKYYEANMRQYVKIYNLGIDTYERTLKNSQDRADLRTYKDYIAIIIKGYDPVAHKELAKFCKEFEQRKILPSLQPSMRKQFKDSISIVKYVKLRVLGEALALVGKKRSDCACALVKYGNLDEIVLAADKKSIIFSSYIDALDVGYKVFVEKKFKALRIYGDFTKQLSQLVMLFKTDPTINPLFGTLQSLAASQTLTNANVVIFLNHPFREYIRDQAFHRVFRIGQDAQTYIYMCELSSNGVPNISTHTADILAWSRQQAEAITGSALSDKQMEDIVSKLHLNQGVSIFTGATVLFRDLFGM